MKTTTEIIDSLVYNGLALFRMATNKQQLAEYKAAYVKDISKSMNKRSSWYDHRITKGIIAEVAHRLSAIEYIKVDTTKCPVCGCTKRGYRRTHEGLLCVRCLRKDKTVTVKWGPAK